MGNAPERIFTWVYEEGSKRYHVWRGKVGPSGDGQTEYVRADLAAPSWQPIETCPSDHVLFHGNTRHDARVVFTGWKAVNGRFYADTGDSVKPTHWMPLPAPPEAD